MNTKIVRLTETAIMIALGTVLSIIKLIDLPYGGSITIAHMLPVILIAYRYGSKWGFCSGLVYGILQLILGMKNLSYATSIWAAIAIIALDYLAAYTVVGIVGFFQKTKLSQPSALSIGVLSVCVLRYFCHVISGCTVWAGLSVPTAEAFLFSILYNATYMIPESIVTLLAALYIGNILDFRAQHLSHLKKKQFSFLSLFLGLISVSALIVDVCIIFGVLQDAETGTFTFTNIGSLSWTLIGILAFISIASFGCIFVMNRSKKS